MVLSRFAVVLVVMLFQPVFPAAQDQHQEAQESMPPKDPKLSLRPPPKAPSSLAPVGEIRLDVTVSDRQGEPVHGLEPWDFKLMDDGKPGKVLSFRESHGVAASGDPPVEGIMVIDEVNLPFQQVAF